MMGVSTARVHTLLSPTLSQPLHHTLGLPIQPNSPCTGVGFIPTTFFGFGFLFPLSNIEYFSSILGHSSPYKHEELIDPRSKVLLC